MVEAHLSCWDHLLECLHLFPEGTCHISTGKLFSRREAATLLLWNGLLRSLELAGDAADQI